MRINPPLVRKVEPIYRIMPDKQKEQEGGFDPSGSYARSPYAYYREPINCPECGKATHELYHNINEGEQPTLMCGNCYEEE